MEDRIKRLAELREELILAASKFDESQVNRDKGGRFAPKSGSQNKSLPGKIKEKIDKMRDPGEYIREHGKEIATQGVAGLAVAGLAVYEAKKRRKARGIKTVMQVGDPELSGKSVKALSPQKPRQIPPVTEENMKRQARRKAKVEGMKTVMQVGDPELSGKSVKALFPQKPRQIPPVTEENMKRQARRKAKVEGMVEGYSSTERRYNKELIAIRKRMDEINEKIAQNKSKIRTGVKSKKNAQYAANIASLEKQKKQTWADFYALGERMDELESTVKQARKKASEM